MDADYTRKAERRPTSTQPPARKRDALGTGPLADDATPQGSPPRFGWKVMLIALGVAALLIPFDAIIVRSLGPVQNALPSDIRGELRMLEQYGALGSLVLVAAIVWLADPKRRANLADLAAAAAISALTLLTLKMAIGRPRPSFLADDPAAATTFLTPFGAYPLGDPPIERHAWELWGGISSNLWSMPSNHTASAAVLSVWLVTVYPRLRPLAWTMIVVVASCRVLFGAHYPSDVAVGAGVGLLVASFVIRRQLGAEVLALLDRHDQSPVRARDHHAAAGHQAGRNAGRPGSARLKSADKSGRRGRAV